MMTHPQGWITWPSNEGGDPATAIMGWMKPPVHSPAQCLIVLCHGHGNDACGMVWLGERWAPHLPDAAFLSLNGWEPCVLHPGTRQWWSLRDRTPETDRAGATRLGPVLAETIRIAAAWLGLTEREVALVGFSQGAMSVLAAGLFEESRIGGEVAGAIISIAGALHLAEEASIPSADNMPAVLLLHGDQDDVVPLTRSMVADSRLKAMHVPVTLTILPGVGHEVTAEEADCALAFIIRDLQADA
ncbi:alpha/beta hydrolase [Granulibacter bethesdensis]|uniref:alpha/beta hydrolase n=1 Tax=Granulibacter bethesdensis TaxID=364410 RepID=UPI000AADED7D|nr:prolyl oligopeptidase family serine peptidase [Granulibacter bethesdensis]